MTETASPRAGTGNDEEQHRTRILTELFRNGYALVLHEKGLTCSSIAQNVVAQCEAYGVDAVICPIDEVVLDKLFRYTILFVVLPLPTGTRADVATRARLEQVVATYRDFRKHGLKVVLTTEEDWRHAGPIQLLLWGAATDEPPDLSNLGSVCVVRQVSDVSSLGDVFSVFRNDSAEEDPHERMANLGIASWKYLQTWGLPSLDDVRRVLDIIDSRIAAYEDPRFPAMYRPHPQFDRNRLQLVLSNPHLEIRNGDLPRYLQNNRERLNAKKKCFQESGAKVSRVTVLDIKNSYPMLHRPGDKDNKKGLQADLKRMYEALVTLDGLPSEVMNRVRSS